MKECIRCGEFYFCECWKESKRELPPIGEVVECCSPKKWFYSSLGRDYFALVEINSELIWISPSLTPQEYSDLEVIHWRRIPPDPKGRKPFIKIRKTKKGYWDPKVIFKKEDL